MQTLLGKNVSYNDTYAVQPVILTAIERPTRVPTMYGTDIWHGYEFSCLYQNGYPFAGMVKIAIDAETPKTVESKSLKLYLNSYNMVRVGQTVKEIQDSVETRIESDLAWCLDINEDLVRAYVFDFSNTDTVPGGPYPIIRSMFESVDTGMEKLTDIVFDGFGFVTEEIKDDQRFMSNILRTNCRVTHQPDWADVFIWIQECREIDKSSLARYLLSMRQEDHFHEEACEKIYNELSAFVGPEAQVLVACLYTRRGGIDICPVRSNNPHLLEYFFYNISDLSEEYFDSKMVR